MAKKKPTYILEHNDPEFWREVRYYCEVEGVPIKEKIMELLREWVAGYDHMIDAVKKFNRKGD